MLAAWYNKTPRLVEEVLYVALNETPGLMIIHGQRNNGLRGVEAPPPWLVMVPLPRGWACFLSLFERLMKTQRSAARRGGFSSSMRISGGKMARA